MPEKFILCEGETDQILVGYYLKKVEGWNYSHNPDKVPFKKENINWFVKDKDLLGLWAVGGNDFSNPLREIMDRCRMEPDSTESVVIFTDHDDDIAEWERFEKILSEVKDLIEEGEIDPAKMMGKWGKVTLRSRFDTLCKLRMSYILVPENQQGALETFMLNTLASDQKEYKNVIDQVRNFISGFKSEVYLRHRREKTKAELGVSLSVFSPDKIFTTIDELLNSVKWEEFRGFGEQFDILKDM